MDEISIVRHAACLSPRLGVAVQAALAAGAIVKSGADKLNVVEQKSVGDLVSEVDRAADRAACAVLDDLSNLPILSEELNPGQTEQDNLWIVDPLDASSAFLMSAGDDFPSVLVALRRDGKTELGVVYFPLTNEWFYAVRGRGAWHDGKRMVCDSNETLGEVWVELNQYGDADLETPFLNTLRQRLRSDQGARLVTSSVPNSGIAMRIASGRNTLAAAVHDNNPRSTKQASWDIAAPQIIMEEAGGVFLNPVGAPSNPFVVEPVIVSRSREIAQQIIKLAEQSLSGATN